MARLDDDSGLRYPPSSGGSVALEDHEVTTANSTIEQVPDEVSDDMISWLEETGLRRRTEKDDPPVNRAFLLKVLKNPRLVDEIFDRYKQDRKQMEITHLGMNPALLPLGEQGRGAKSIVYKAALGREDIAKKNVSSFVSKLTTDPKERAAFEGKINKTIEKVASGTRGVAMKVLDSRNNDPKRVEHEVRTTLKYQDVLPSIAGITGGSLEKDSDWHIDMELLQGHDLGEYFIDILAAPDEHPLEERSNVAALMSIAALPFEKAGLKHRDFKPANLFLEQLPDGHRIKVLDLGMINEEGGVSDFATQDGTAIGTLNYMAPEAAVGQSTMKSDVFSLGIMYVQMFTGTIPYEIKGGNMKEKCTARASLSQQDAAKVRIPLSSEQMKDAGIVQRVKNLEELFESMIHPIAEKRPAMETVATVLRDNSDFSHHENKEKFTDVSSFDDFKMQMESPVNKSKNFITFPEISREDWNTLTACDEDDIEEVLQDVAPGIDKTTVTQVQTRFRLGKKTLRLIGASLILFALGGAGIWAVNQDTEKKDNPPVLPVNPPVKVDNPPVPKPPEKEPVQQAMQLQRDEDGKIKGLSLRKNSFAMKGENLLPLYNSQGATQRPMGAGLLLTHVDMARLLGFKSTDKLPKVLTDNSEVVKFRTGWYLEDEASGTRFIRIVQLGILLEKDGEVALYTDLPEVKKIMEKEVSRSGREEDWKKDIFAPPFLTSPNVAVNVEDHWPSTWSVIEPLFNHENFVNSMNGTHNISRGYNPPR